MCSSDGRTLHGRSPTLHDCHGFQPVPAPSDPGGPGSTTPLYAAVPGHPFTARLIEELHKQRYLDGPVRTTGNRYMQRMLRKHKPEIKVWPMHYFIPEHFNGWRYSGPDRIYAKHSGGPQGKAYPRGDGLTPGMGSNCGFPSESRARLNFSRSTGSGRGRARRSLESASQEHGTTHGGKVGHYFTLRTAVSRSASL